MAGAHDVAIVSQSGGPGTPGIAGNNSESNPAAVLQALSNCNTFWTGTALATCSGYTACCQVGVKQYDGQLWALGERGYTLFNTIVPPNAKQYPWHSCRLTELPPLRRRGRVSSMPAAIIRAVAISLSLTEVSGSSRIRSVC